MFTNLYEKLKKIIKENYKNILLFIALYLICMWPVNYYIIIGGGIMEVGNRITVEDANPSKGSFNLAYVSEIKGTTITYLLSYVMKDWKRIKVSEYTYDSEEDIEDVNFRGTIDLLNANDHAIKNAYLKANKSYEVIDHEFYVYYTDKDNKNDLRVGDQIKEIDGEKITSLEQFRKILSSHKKDDQVQLLIMRDKKEKKIDATLYEEDGQSILGVYVSQINNYKTTPQVNIKFKSSESGPSGGIIETLDIYNKLVKKDITKGLKIAGTGEIDSDGNVLTIGEVKYKLLGAVHEKADVFIVPKGENYEECKKLKKTKKLKIKILGVSTLDEALEKLDKLKK